MLKTLSKGEAVQKAKIEMPFLRTPYNYDTNAASDESGLACRDESKAIQSAAEECDINTIVRRFGITGQLPEGVRAPTYADFTEVTDFKTAMDAIAVAGEAFDRMPGEIRARFNNDPGAFVDFCSDEGNRAEAEKLGLVLPKQEVQKGPPGPVTTSKELVEKAPGGAKEPSKGGE